MNGYRRDREHRGNRVDGEQDVRQLDDAQDQQEGRRKQATIDSHGARGQRCRAFRQRPASTGPRYELDAHGECRYLCRLRTGA